jgi:hypothetical protein
MFVEKVIGAAIGAAVFGATVSVVNKKMQTGSRPVWTGACNGTVITVLEHTVHGHVGYEVFGSGGGKCVSLGRYPTYPQGMTLVEQWNDYLKNGGTLKAWLAHCQPQPVKATTQRVSPQKAIAKAAKK